MASKGAAIMKLLQGTNLRELNLSLKSYLAPLFGNSESDKEDISQTDQHRLAKEYLPFLVQLLKVCGAKLASVPAREDRAAVSMADELFSAMVTAIDGLNHLRSQFTGDSFEMELQRYGLVRRLMAWKRYDAALLQSQLLFRSLCQLSSLSESKVSTVNQATSGRICKGGVKKKKNVAGMLSAYDDSFLCPPRQADQAAGLPALVVAAVTDLIWCIAESSTESLSCFQMAVRLPEQLAPWISVLDPVTASKQCDTLFRAIYKCTLAMLVERTKFEAGLIQQFCFLTLSHCASSTQSDQYAKVARKLCSSLSYQGSDWCSSALEVCTAAFDNILSHNKLQDARNSYEFSELVEYFARSCQTSSQFELGWFQIYKLVDHIKQVSPGAPVVITGLYAVGLVLMQPDTYRISPQSEIKGNGGAGNDLPDLAAKCLSTDANFFEKACLLLQGADEVLKSLLLLEQAPALEKTRGIASTILDGQSRPDSIGKQNQEVMGRTFMVAARALHYVQKSFSRFIQVVWNAYSATSLKEELPYRPFDSALGNVLQLFYSVFENGMRCSKLSDNEKEYFKKGIQMASQASLAALRVSLLLQDCVQERFELVSDMIHHLQPEEQLWLMSSTYNMGVQLFNTKQYNLACWPLNLANKGAWAKVHSSYHEVKAGSSINETVSEACAKCLALVDAQNRSGEPGRARLTLIDGLLQWTKAQAEIHSIKLPHSLLRSFVKLMCVENSALAHEKSEGEVWSLYTFICDIQPPLPAGIVGLLLEEEYTICETMEAQYPDSCHLLKEQIIKCLLDKVYAGGHFALERSRVLMKKCRDSRMHGAENLSTCIQYISDAVSILETALEGSGENTGDLWQVAHLQKQLAVAYSIAGICSYELDPCCQEFLANIVLSLKKWRQVLESHATHGGLPEPGIFSTIATHKEEPLVLLLNICDLLSIQGQGALLYEAQEVILKMIPYPKPPSANEEWVEFWMNVQGGHLLCAVPFPSDLLASIRQSLDETAYPQQYWQRCYDLFPGSLLEAHHYSAQGASALIHEANKSSTSTVENSGAIELINKMLHARLSGGQKSSQFSLHTAELYHLIAELSLKEGDTHEAIRCAKEAFRLRSRLFKYIFRGFGQRASGLSSNATSNTSARGDPKILQLREGLGPMATSSWPFSVKALHCLSHPSQWRILGDYIKSIMQVGVIFEQMGAVDEAERSFREGHRLALSQNLPLALASFSSCLGEVHRKRELWETAESYFIQAKQIFNNLRTSTSCESCIHTGKALLELRFGDLVRHRWHWQQGKAKEDDSHSNLFEHYFAKTPTDALSDYTAATASLSQLLKSTGGKDDQENRELLNSHETQITMLRSLQKKGKDVSLEIMSHHLEETGTSVSITRKSRLRKSVQTRSSGLSNCEAGSVGMENDLSSLCNDMRLASLADSGDSSQAQSRKNTSEPIHCRNGLRSEGRNVEAVLSFQEQVAVQVMLEDGSTTKQKYAVVQTNMQLSPETRTEGNISHLTEAIRECQSLRSRILGCSSSIEDWPACKWAQLGQKLLSRVLLQIGKCHLHLGELDKAAGSFEHSLSILDISSDVQSGKEVGSLFPVEEGALLYHISRLWLQRGQHGEASRHATRSSRRGSDNLEFGKVQNLNRLYRAFSLCRQVPLLLQKIAKLLAILHVPSAWGVPPTIPQGNYSMQEVAEVAAYFHQASLGTTIRQQHLSVLDSKLDDTPLEDPQQLEPSLAKGSVEKMQQALRLAPVNLGNVAKQARDFWQCLPCSSACCISFVSMEDMRVLKGSCLPLVEDSASADDWLLVTRLTVESKPIIVLLPALPLLKNPPRHASTSKSGESSSNPYDLSDDDDSCNKPSEEPKGLPSDILNHIHQNKQTVLQRIAAEFGSVLEESRLSTSGTHPVVTMEEKSVWWRWRMELDARLSVVLRMVEDSWLGPFKCLLLGEPQQASMTKSFEHCAVYLLEMMSSIMMTQGRSSTVEHGFVKVLLQAVGCLSASELERAIAEMLGFHGYHFCNIHANECGAQCNMCKWKLDEAGKYEQIRQLSDSFRAAYMVSSQASENDTLKCLFDEGSGKRRSRRQAKANPGPRSQSPLDIISKMVSDGSYCNPGSVKRQPLQLILDSDCQALPWESLPFLRDHEFYRIPSLGTLHAVYIQHQYESISDVVRATDSEEAAVQKAEGRRVKAVKRSTTSTAKEVDCDKPVDVTCVNPYNTYYILNPNGDLPSTQAAFEDWFTQQPGWKGKAGTVPTAEEYQMGLQNHDLFVYLGHGSGDQFLPERCVRQLDHCAASLLMGCSSGRLSVRGEYQPVGVVLSYLMAGCPAVIANLWDVTDGDIDRFSRSLLHSWLAFKPGSLNSDSEKASRDMSDCELSMREGQNIDLAFQARHARKVNISLLETQVVCQAAFQDVHRMSSAIGQSRNACRLPHLIGASPVCYGVPTGVWKQIHMKTTS